MKRGSRIIALVLLILLILPVALAQFVDLTGYSIFDGGITGKASSPASTNVSLSIVAAPDLTLFEPLNVTYVQNTLIIPLKFFADDYLYLAYSLDGGPYVPVLGNTTFSTSSGSHNLRLYANNSYGETNRTVFFVVNLTSPTPISGGGGGRGRRGDITNETLPAPTFGICLTKWECGAWSACVDGTETRSCLDKNSCQTARGKPSEQRSCINIFGAPIPFDYTLFIIAIIIAILIVLLALFMIYSRDRRKRRLRSSEKELGHAYHALGKGNINDALRHYKRLKNSFSEQKLRVSPGEAKKLHEDGMKLYGEIIKKMHNRHSHTI